MNIVYKLSGIELNTSEIESGDLNGKNRLLEWKVNDGPITRWKCGRAYGRMIQTAKNTHNKFCADDLKKKEAAHKAHTSKAGHIVRLWAVHLLS